MLHGLGGTEYVHADLRKRRFPLHFHDTFVIEQVLTGVDWCSDTELVAESDEVYVHFPFAAHTGGTKDSKRLVYRALYPDRELFCRLTGLATNEVPRGVNLVSRNRQLIRALRDLFGRCESTNVGEEDERTLKNVFEIILGEYSLLCPERSNSVPNHQNLILAREYLLANFERDVTTNELSDACDVSQFHLIRSFRRQFGITPRQFLISHRVSMAKKLIASGSSITTAAYSTGFSDHSHLTRYFKKITGYSPRQMKQTKIQARSASE